MDKEPSPQQESKSKIEQFIERIKKKPFYIILTLVVAFVIGFGSLTGALVAIPTNIAKMVSFFHPITSPTPIPVKPPQVGAIRYTHVTPHWGGLVAWSPDGKRIADTSSDGTIQLWDALSGQHPAIFEGHKGKTVSAVAWSYDNTRLASADSGGIIQIWLADTRVASFNRSIASLLEEAGKQASNSGVTALAWSPNDQEIAIGDKNGDFVVVNLGEMTVRTYDINVLGNYQDAVSGLAWSPAGKQLAVGAGFNVDIWNMDSFPPQRIRTLPGGPIVSLAWSPNGKLIAGMLLLAYSTAPAVWDLAKNEQMPQQIAGQELSLAWACDSNRLALGGQNAVTIWDYAAQKALHNFTNVVGATSVAWSPDGSLIASGSEDGRILIWQASDQKSCK